MLNYLLAEEGETPEGIDFQAIWGKILNWCTTEGIRILIAIIVLLLSFKIVNFFAKRIAKIFEKREVDKTIAKVSVSIGRKFVKILLLIMFISYLGINTSSIVATITAGAVTVGLALQGALSNFAAGILILVLRTYRVGDYIECSGVSGTVEDIGLFQTKLVTPDNRVITLPNGNAINGAVVNYSIKKTRRVDLSFNVSYDTDFRKAKYLIREQIEKSGLALTDPEPFINVKEHGSSAIEIVVRVWVYSADYWNFYWIMMEGVKIAFDKNGITIPYPQMDVHMIENSQKSKPIDENHAFVKSEIEKDEMFKKSAYDNHLNAIETVKKETEKEQKKELFGFVSTKKEKKKKAKKENSK